MSWARVHRWLAIVLAALLVIWSLTGLAFHLKPGWDRAYDQLSAEQRGKAITAAELTPPAALAVAAPLERVELFATALGWLYRVRTAKGSELYDAKTGARLSPLEQSAIETLVADAITRSPHRAAYGTVGKIELGADSARIELSGGPLVTVGRNDARLSQRGGDTDRIDWLYRIHYLQLTGSKSIDRVLAVLGLALIWAVMIPGIVLFVRVLRHR